MFNLLKRKVVMNKVYNISPTMGCDPEFFFKSEGKVVGAEKVIPANGLIVSGASKFIIDGVQAELNPCPSSCRALLGNEIRRCFNTLKSELDKSKGKITADFSRTVEISKENLDELQEDSKKFGCAPSKSIYQEVTGIKLDKVDPSIYRTRAAGGHIHIGKDQGIIRGLNTRPPTIVSGLTRALTTDYAKTVTMLDIICGNTSVLIDRDEGNIERRKLYGKAGEFRLPNHGLEYRTLSNYWLTSYPLMSFAFGMARLAVQLIADPKHSNTFFNEFTSKVKIANVHTAINGNDFDMAMDNFKAIEPLLAEVTVNNDEGSHPVNYSNLAEFHHFIEVVRKDGLKYWFPQNPLTHWTTHGECHTGGFRDFLRITVKADMNNKRKLLK